MLYSFSLIRSFLKTNSLTNDEIVDALNIHSFEVGDIFEKTLEIDVLPNRAGDCLGHLGIAKELSAIKNIEVKEMRDNTFNATNKIKIETKKCPYYLLAEVEINNTKETEKNIADELEILGQQLRGRVVDLTNYVMLETGNPTHAFDADKVDGEISVREAKNGEEITLLTGEKVSLKEGDIVIVDEKDILAIGGIKGGKKAEITKDTKRILIESANFNSHSIRSTSRRLGLVTESSKRFSQSLPTVLADIAMMRLIELLDCTVKEKFSGGSCNKKPFLANISESDLAILGGTYDIEKTLSKLSFKTKRIENPRKLFLENAEKLIGTPYFYGASVSKDAPEKFDCSSFINYLALLSGITIPRVSLNQYLFGELISKEEVKPGDLIFSDGDKDKVHKKHIKEPDFLFLEKKEIPENGIGHCGIVVEDDYVIDAIGDNGGNKVIKTKINEHIYFSKLDYYVRIFNDDEARIIVEVPAYRQDIKNTEDLIEEIARLHGYDSLPSEKLSNMEVSHSKISNYKDIITAKLLELGCYEVITYIFQNKGEVCVSYPLAKDKGCLRTDLTKGLKVALKDAMHNIDWLGEKEICLFEIGSVFQKENTENLKEEIHLAIACSPKSSLLKKVKETLKEIGIDSGEEKEGVLEINLTELFESLPEKESPKLPSIVGKKYKPLPLYPPVIRDISMFSLTNNKEIAEKIIREVAGELCERITLFDEFEKDGKTSFAFRIVFQSYEKTLNDKIVLEIMKKIEDNLRAKNFEIR